VTATENAAWDNAGPADLGSVDFATLVRRRSPNDALAAPSGGTPHARPDVTTQPTALTSADVASRTHAALVAIAGVARVQRVAADRWVVRSALMRFPDTITVRTAERADGQRDLFIYSASKLGHSDLGVNLKRINAVLSALAG
jgi:hypothetical protein